VTTSSVLSVAEVQTFPLESIRTDGWFERIGESIGSFQALCDIVGARFFAFAMITGARITALTVDRRTPDNTLVDFVVGADEESSSFDSQRLTLSDFRRRLVSALVTDEPMGPAPTRATDTETVQLHIGVRYLLLAPLYGYSLMELCVTRRGSEIRVLHDGVDVAYALSAFRARLRTHVREELERQQRGTGRGAIDLARVAQAEEAAARGDALRVVELLGAWPAPLAIFLRTPEGQLLSADTRGVIAKGLGLLGSACIDLSEAHKGEEVLRLAVQYAGDGPAAAEMYTRLGTAILADSRPGEAIAPLRRAANLGAAGHIVWPKLAEALVQRQRFVAALAAIFEARAAGVDEARLAPTLGQVEAALGPHIAPWRSLVG
jgi:hypothetical protein